MLADKSENIVHLDVHHAVEHAAEHASEHGAGGVDFIMHHILDAPLIKLPTVFGIDLSITKHVLMMWIAAALLIAVFTIAFRARRLVPRGLANALETIVLYLRDDLFMPSLGHEGRHFAPYLLTAFFFILLCNLLGLVPLVATATGNISVTAGLAILTFIMVQPSVSKTITSIFMLSCTLRNITEGGFTLLIQLKECLKLQGLSQINLDKK